MFYYIFPPKKNKLAVLHPLKPLGVNKKNLLCAIQVCSTDLSFIQVLQEIKSLHQHFLRDVDVKVFNLVILFRIFQITMLILIQMVVAGLIKS